jgi:hypothetical protein
MDTPEIKILILVIRTEKHDRAKIRRCLSGGNPTGARGHFNIRHSIKDWQVESQLPRDSRLKQGSLPAATRRQQSQFFPEIGNRGFV